MTERPIYNQSKNSYTMIPNRPRQYHVKLNNIDKVEQLLQETYDLACQQYITIQDEINRITNTTVLKDLDIEGKEKYAKIMNNYLTLQQKAISQKHDIAKLMTEVLKSGGNLEEAVNSTSKASSLNLADIRKLVKDANTTAPETKTYSLTNR